MIAELEDELTTRKGFAARVVIPPPRRARRGCRRYYGIKDKRGIAELAAPGR